MGRRATGRKYAKHISIQVDEQHNEDLKQYCQYLNEVAPLENGNWTIRDVILTMLYGNWNRDPTWMEQNHFEKLTSSDLEKLRNKLNTQTPNAKEMEPEPLDNVVKKEKQQKPQLKLALKKSFSNYLSELDQITGE